MRYSTEQLQKISENKDHTPDTKETIRELNAQHRKAHRRERKKYVICAQQ